MPKKLEKQLNCRARRKGLKGRRAAAYVYGTLRKTGWRPKRELHVPEGTKKSLRRN